MKLLVTGACAVTARSIVRALKKEPAFTDATFIGVDVLANLYGLYEGLFERIYRVPWVHEDNYKDVFHQICDKENIDAAIVVPEKEVWFWTRNQIPVPALLPPPGFADVVISKRRMYDTLHDTKLIPQYQILGREQIIQGLEPSIGNGTVWLRDYSEGSASASGAMKATSQDEMRAWALLNPTIQQFMISEFLPGRNLACCMLFNDGELLKYACYERLEYFMAKVAPSGITGNISRGRLINDDVVVEVSKNAVLGVADLTCETMTGLVTVDLKEHLDCTPRVTEINLRHTAPTSAFAEGGVNMAAAQLYATLKQYDKITNDNTQYPDSNLILRDIDGSLIYVDHHEEVQIGHCYPTPLTRN